MDERDELPLLDAEDHKSKDSSQSYFSLRVAVAGADRWSVGA